MDFGFGITIVPFAPEARPILACCYALSREFANRINFRLELVSNN
jgi:hypothetical protein